MRKEFISEMSKQCIPMWVIVKCLKIYKGDEEAVRKRITDIYNVIGDHPEIVIARNEEILRMESEG